MHKFFLAVDEAQYHRMFVPGEAQHRFMPAFFGGKLPFKTSLDSAVSDALRSHTPAAKNAVYNDTTWIVLHFSLDDAEVGRLFMRRHIHLSAAEDGYDITESISQPTYEWRIRLPKLGPVEWLRNLGFPVYASPLTSDYCHVCDASDNVDDMYHSAGGLICHECLMKQEMDNTSRRF